MPDAFSAIGASLCGVILPDGQDCQGLVSQAAPFNLCDAHIQAVYEWQRDNDRTLRKEVRCPVCDQYRALPGDTAGLRCEHCGYTTNDYDGPRSSSGAEDDRAKARLEALEILQQRKRTPHPELVFYLSFRDRILIGTTKNLRQRLRSLPGENVIGIEPGGADLARRRLRQFESLRGEANWLEAAPELVEHARALMGHASSWEERVMQWRRR